MVACLTALPAAQGTVPNQPTYFTFSAPVSLPGATLPAGKYEFRLANSLANRNIVQIYNLQNRKLVTTIYAIPAHRADVPEKAEIRFLETPSNMPPAVQTWWYPGLTDGHEFIYPRQQAQTLAKLNDGVLTTDGGADSGKMTRLSKNGETPANEKTDAKLADKSQVADMSASDNSAPAPAQTMAMNDTASSRKALPKTAGNLSMIAAVGFLSLVSGIVLMTTRRRVS